MRAKTKQPDNSRRAFVKHTTLAGAGLAVGAALPGTAAAATAQSESDDGKQQGYHLTQHIIDYYKSAAS